MSLMEEILCKKCNISKNIEDYAYKNRNKGIRFQWCNLCRRNYMNNYYTENKVHINSTYSEKRKQIRIRNRQYVYDYYKNNPCVDCGESNPMVLEFDHKEGVNKYKEISSLVNNRCSLELLAKEIAKCDVRCANCHRKRTAIVQEWYKDLVK